MPKVSIIVPVYNAEKYISRCIESVLSQDFNDYELILINDGSEDSSLEVCETYRFNYKQIKVFSQKNFGASSARNIGLQNAIGEYVCFIDADDYVGKNYISTLFEDIQFENGIDLVIQGLTVVSGIENSRVTFEVPTLYNLKIQIVIFSEISICSNFVDHTVSYLEHRLLKEKKFYLMIILFFQRILISWRDI